MVSQPNSKRRRVIHQFSSSVSSNTDDDAVFSSPFPQEVAAAYDVEAMPTFHFVKNGVTVETVVGARKENLLAQIEKHCAAAVSAASA